MRESSVTRILGFNRIIDSLTVDIDVVREFYIDLVERLCSIAYVYSRFFSGMYECYIDKEVWCDANNVFRIVDAFRKNNVNEIARGEFRMQLRWLVAPKISNDKRKLNLLCAYRCQDEYCVQCDRVRSDSRLAEIKEVKYVGMELNHDFIAYIMYMHAVFLSLKSVLNDIDARSFVTLTLDNDNISSSGMRLLADKISGDIKQSEIPSCNHMDNDRSRNYFGRFPIHIARYLFMNDVERSYALAYRGGVSNLNSFIKSIICSKEMRKYAHPVMLKAIDTFLDKLRMYKYTGYVGYNDTEIDFNVDIYGVAVNGRADGTLLKFCEYVNDNGLDFNLSNLFHTNFLGFIVHDKRTGKFSLIGFGHDEDAICDKYGLSPIRNYRSLCNCYRKLPRYSEGGGNIEDAEALADNLIELVSVFGH